MGQVVQAGCGQNPARQAAMRAVLSARPSPTGLIGEALRSGQADAAGAAGDEGDVGRANGGMGHRIASVSVGGGWLDVMSC